MKFNESPEKLPPLFSSICQVFSSSSLSSSGPHISQDTPPGLDTQLRRWVRGSDLWGAGLVSRPLTAFLFSSLLSCFPSFVGTTGVAHKLVFFALQGPLIPQPVCSLCRREEPGARIFQVLSLPTCHLGITCTARRGGVRT